MSYQSPIEAFYSDIEYRFEDAVFKAIQKVDIKVDRNELIKALKYDRAQYDKGYADGRAEPRFGEWISVDNPPKVEKYEEVEILVTDGENITNGVATNWDDDDDEVRIHGRFPIDNKNIKWWMPLPKLPKGEKK